MLQICASGSRHAAGNPATEALELTSIAEMTGTMLVTVVNLR